ncbi:MAG: thiamine phosphate synthase [Armatimonadota bacterium]
MSNAKREVLRGLYVITDPRLGGGHLEGAHAALQGGARIIQLRDKEATTRQLVEYAQALRTLTREYNALLIINDRLDVALAVDADGVHLGQDDLPVPLARRIAGERLIIGVSVETVDEAARAEAEGADYLGVGPMFATATKPDAGTPVGPERLREIKQRVHIPVFGIAGITLENASQVLQAGADGICVISAILGAPDPVEATRQFVALLARSL